MNRADQSNYVTQRQARPPADQSQTPEEEFLYQRGYRGLGEARSQSFRRGYLIETQDQTPFRPQRGSR